MQEIEAEVYMFLTLALDKDEWSASAALPPRIMPLVSME
jgi:hypothetical protein